MPRPPTVVHEDDLPWETWTRGAHYNSQMKRLTPGMARKDGHLGVCRERIAPGCLSAPFHYHLKDDEVVLVVSGRGRLRLGDEVHDIGPGDAVSFPAGARVAHQLHNHTDEWLEILVIGGNSADEVCYYPDSDKWLVREAGVILGGGPRDYWDGEPEPPLLTRGDPPDAE